MQQKSIAKNAIFKSILNLCNIILPIFVMPAVTEALTVKDISYITTGETFNNFLVAFASFGVYQYGLREISKVRDDKTKLRQTFTTLFLMTTISTIVVYVGYMIFLLGFYRGNPAFYACLIIGFNIIINLFYVEWINEALENYDFITIKTMIIKIIYSVLVLALIKSPDNYLLYLFLGMAVNIANNLSSFIFINRQLKFDFSNLQFSKHIKPMFLVLILSNTGLLYTQLDKLMVYRFSTADNLASYGTAQKVMGIINALMLTIIQVSMPRLSNDIGNDHKESYNSLLNFVMKIYFLLLFPAAIGLLCVSKQVMWIFKRSTWEYVPYSSLLMMFAIYMLTVGIQGIMSNQIIYLNGKEKEDVKVFFIGGIVNLILNTICVFTGMFNGTSAIFTTAISNIVVIILEYIVIKQKIDKDIKIFTIDNMKYLLYSLLFIPITYLINYIFLNKDLSKFGTYSEAIATGMFNSKMIISCAADVLVCGVLYLLVLIMTKDTTFKYICDRVFKFKKR